MDIVVKLFPNLFVVTHRARMVGRQDRHRFVLRKVTVAFDQLFDGRSVVVSLPKTLDTFVLQHWRCDGGLLDRKDREHATRPNMVKEVPRSPSGRGLD